MKIGDGIHHAAGRHELDPVRAILDISPYYARNIVNRIGDICAFRQIEIGRKWSSIAVAASDGNAASGGGDARPLN